MTEPGDDWIERQEAIDLSGLNARTFARREMKREIQGRWRAGTGKKFYDPEEVIALAKASGTDVDEVSAERVLLDLLKQATAQLQKAYDHIEAQNKSLTEPIKAANEHYKNLIEAQGKQNELLTTRWYQTLELVEKAISNEHERARQLQKDDVSEKRKTEAWEVLKVQVPKMLNQIGQGAKLRELFSSLTGEQLLVLLDEQNTFLTDAQKDVAREIVERMTKEKSNGKADAERTGEQTVSGAPGGPGAAQGSDGGVEADGPPRGEGASGRQDARRSDRRSQRRRSKRVKEQPGHAGQKRR